MRERSSFPDLVLARIAAQGKTGFKPPSQWDVRSVIERMKAEEANAEHMRATVEIDAWIRTRRQQVRSEEALMAAMSGRGTIEESGALYRLARPVLERYVRHLVESDTVDHEGTILKAWRYLLDGAVTPPWKAILVDEYQDVNPAQAAFVHALLTPREPGRPSSRARLTAVGDDWQAIFSFQGGDVDLIRQFNDSAGGHEGVTERIELRQTYRFGQPIADSTRRFVTRGRGAIDREVIGAPGMAPEVYEKRAESEYRKSWCRWRWIRENMYARTLAGALLEPCPPPPEEEMRRWRAEREELQRRAGWPRAVTGTDMGPGTSRPQDTRIGGHVESRSGRGSVQLRGTGLEVPQVHRGTQGRQTVPGRVHDGSAVTQPHRRCQAQIRRLAPVRLTFPLMR